MSAPNTLPLPNISQPLVDPKTGLLTSVWYKYFTAADAALRALVGASATALGSDGGVLTSGFQETPVVIPSPAAGASITPNPSRALKQQVQNNGAFSIVATSEVGDVELLIVNGASPGAVTFSGFSKQWTGDSLDTTVGHQFAVFIYGLPNGQSAYVIKALQ